MAVMWLCGSMVGFGSAAIICTHFYWKAREGEIMRYSWSIPGPIYIDCPHANWSLKCPHVGTEECKECPVFKARPKPDGAIYVFPKGAEQSVEAPEGECK